MNKQEIVKHLTDLMATVQMAYYDGRGKNEGFCGDVGNLWVHEREGAGISIDLYHFEGDGLPVCEGLEFHLADADAIQTPIRPFCIIYDPENEQKPLAILCTTDGQDDFELSMPYFPAEVLQRIAQWMERQMPVKSEVSEAKGIIALWSDWCVGYDDENLWLDYMVKHPKGHCNRQHLQEKWDYCYKKYGNKAAMNMFWRELDNDNRTILTEYVTTQWHKN